MPIDPRVLRHAFAFQLLDDEGLSELAAHVDEASFAAGDTIFRAGDPGGVMHVVLSGRVEVSILDGDREDLERLFARRPRAALDYQVNLKAELEIMELHEKVDRLEQRLAAAPGGPPGTGPPANVVTVGRVLSP